MLRIAAVTVALTPLLLAAQGDTVFMIQIDGARYSVVDTLYRQGKLPGMKRLIRDKKGVLLRAVTSFPSSTAPSLPELMVGRYSDRCQPDLLRRVQGFDRESGQIARYEFERKAWDTRDVDLFDLVAQQGRRSFSYFEGEFRSASVNDFNPLTYRVEFATGYANLPTVNYDRQVIDEVLRDLRAEKPPPGLVFVGLGAADINGHARSPDGPEYAQAIVENDAQLQRLIAALEKIEHPKGNSVYQHSHFFIYGDHGMVSTSQHLNLGRSLNQAGILAADGADLGAMLQASLVKDWYKNVDAVILGIGSNIAELQVRRRTPAGKRRPWRERPSLIELRSFPVATGRGTVDLIALLTGHVGMDLVLIPEAAGRVQVFAPGGGEGLVVRQDPVNGPRRFAYQVRRIDGLGRDPLGYLQDDGARALVTPAKAELLQFHDEADWLTATAQTARPYAPPLIPKAFDVGPTAPDIIVTSKNGFGFLPVVRGDHGNLTSESMVSFLLVASPELESGVGDGQTVRLIDAHAEVRHLLELPADPLTDSRGLAATK
ncbi:MAG: alkaline phosphatase family protein [Pseudomonadota bacterium]